MAGVMSRAQPASAAGGPNPGPVFLILFGAAFFLAGMALFVFVFLLPLANGIAARSWTETPCTIVASKVTTHRGHKSGTTYGVQLRYAYRVDGREFQSDRHRFFNGSGGGRAASEAVVRQNPPGRKTVCYVNPRAPADAVLDRTGSGGLATGLFTLVFVAIGAGVMTAGFRARRRAKTPPPLSAGAAPPARAGASTGAAGEITGPVVLRAEASRGGAFAAALFMAVVWNVLVWGVFWPGFNQTGPGAEAPLFRWAFALLFGGAGVAAAGMALRRFLLLFAPRIELTLSAGAVPLGGTAALSWRLRGRAGAIRALRLRLEGREEATYRSGKKNRTDKRAFAAFELFHGSGLNDIRCGRTTLCVPPDSMHSFASDHHKIVWTLRVEGEIPWWPDVQDEFPLTVTPVRAAPSLDEPTENRDARGA